MRQQYFSTKGTLSRVILDENNDPSYCETYKTREGKFVINNLILDDLYNHPDAVEISGEEFEKRLQELKALPKK